MEKSKTCVYKIKNLITGLLLCDRDFRVKEHDEKLAENLKIYLSNVLDGEKFKTPKVSISYITSIPTTISEIYPDLKFFQTKNRRFKKR